MNSNSATRDKIPLVYIVDDDDAVRFAVALLVSTCGWEPRAFGSVEDFNAARNAEPTVACLVLDLNMPGTSGADLLESLSPPLPAIVITGHTDSPLAERARRAGARTILKKPFSDQVLIGHIRAALAQAA